MNLFFRLDKSLKNVWWPKYSSITRMALKLNVDHRNLDFSDQRIRWKICKVNIEYWLSQKYFFYLFSVAVTQTLQEALTREKILEEKLIKIKTNVDKNIGKTHTDLLRLFEKMKQDLSSLYDTDGIMLNFDAAAYEKVRINIHYITKYKLNVIPNR